MERKFKKSTFGGRLCSMLAVDFRRMFKTPLFYIIVASALVLPIIILVMTTMMDGTVPINPETGLPGEPIEGFDNVWQIIGTVSGDSSASSGSMNMSLTSMCNINMLYFFIAVLVCIFIAGDFRSGYAKNIFAVRSGRSEYIVSKTLVCCVGAALMLVAFFVGSMLGGVISKLPFEMVGFGAANVLMCVVSKLLLVLVFVPIYVLMSVIAKPRLWLSLILSFATGMLLFTMIPMITPLNAGALNVILCAACGVGFSFGFGVIGNIVLKKIDLI